MKKKAFPISAPILLLVVGAKGAVGSTLAAAVKMGRQDPDVLKKSLTTRHRFLPHLSAFEFKMAGWDTSRKPYPEIWEENGILPEAICRRCREGKEKISVRKPPDTALSITDQIKGLQKDIRDFKKANAGAFPVLVNLLPAAPGIHQTRGREKRRTENKDPETIPDTAYAFAAVSSGIPVVNFTPNMVETPELLETALKKQVCVVGRDGKTGQTFFKVLLASALKARAFFVDGWYSLNLLGNADGRNLMIPGNACGKLANKTAVLDTVLGIPNPEKNGGVFHKVRIDYYPPRGDAKEAWDVIDFHGLFGLPMSLRVNLLGRDSILAAPLVLDLARWMIILTEAGFSGAVPELGFYFKIPVGEKAPMTFQDQIAALDALEKDCLKAIGNRRGRIS